jgi:hypothetical protein
VALASEVGQCRAREGLVNLIERWVNGNSAGDAPRADERLLEALLWRIQTQRKLRQL